MNNQLFVMVGVFNLPNYNKEEFNTESLFRKHKGLILLTNDTCKGFVESDITNEDLQNKLVNLILGLQTDNYIFNVYYIKNDPYDIDINKVDYKTQFILSFDQLGQFIKIYYPNFFVSVNEAKKVLSNCILRTFEKDHFLFNLLELSNNNRLVNHVFVSVLYHIINNKLNYNPCLLYYVIKLCRFIIPNDIKINRIKKKFKLKLKSYKNLSLTDLYYTSEICNIKNDNKKVINKFISDCFINHELNNNHIYEKDILLIKSNCYSGDIPIFTDTKINNNINNINTFEEYVNIFTIVCLCFKKYDYNQYYYYLLLKLNEYKFEHINTKDLLELYYCIKITSDIVNIEYKKLSNDLQYKLYKNITSKFENNLIENDVCLTLKFILYNAH